MGWFRDNRPAKYAGALQKLTANLYEASTTNVRADHAPQVLRFERGESPFRFVCFCLGTAFYWSYEPEYGEALDSGLKLAFENIAHFALTSEGRSGFFGPEIDVKDGVAWGQDELLRTISGWKDYSTDGVSRITSDQRRPHDARSARIVSVMLRRVESANPLTDEDAVRLEPLSKWIEVTTGVLPSSFRTLAS